MNAQACRVLIKAKLTKDEAGTGQQQWLPYQASTTNNMIPDPVMIHKIKSSGQIFE